MMKKNIRFLFLCFSILMLLFFLCCDLRPQKTIYFRNGKEYGAVQGAFRRRWWNYYKRGLSFAEGEFFQESIIDLKEAIKQREKDQRMARTYGMHFVDYFPHRELGIIYYEIGRLQEAKTELEVSLTQFPSSKARFYLDRVLKELIEQEGKKVIPPQLALDLKADEFWTKEDPVIISGVAEDENYVTSVMIKGMPLFLEGSEKRLPFKKSFDLPQGLHTIEVLAENLLGKVTRHKVIIHVDREGPIITLDKIDFNQFASTGDVEIYGSIYDEAGVLDLSINRQPVDIQQVVEVFFTKRLAPDADYIELISHDKLGNQTAASIPLKRNSRNVMPLRLASIDLDGTTHLIAGILGPKDIEPPNIKLKDWTDTQTVFLDKVYIEGEVNDESEIDSLMINKNPILRRKGHHIFFSHFAKLEKGENTLTIWARDEAGNIASKTITIMRRIPKALQLSERLSLTTFPFEENGTVLEKSLIFQDRLIDALVNQNRFRVVERSKLDIILEEQKLSRTKLIDKATALMLGKLTACQSIVTGTIIETRKGIEVIARIIDTETSEILDTEDAYDEAKDTGALRSLAEGIAIKFHRDFPLVDGLIIDSQGNYLFTDLGQDAIKLLRRLIVYREEPIKHPLTGRVLGADNKIIGHARIIQVMPNMSKAELLELKAGNIKAFDNVIAQ